MKIDTEGNLYATGPGGVLIFTPDGKHIGTIQPTEQPANVAWGDTEGKTLYYDGPYRPLQDPSQHPWPAAGS